jgi:hypothetical protein
VHTRYLISGLILAGAGCTSMQVIDPAQVIPNQHPPLQYVYVQKSNGEVLEVLSPAIHGDTLAGTRYQTGEPFSVPLKDITWVRAREHDKTRTLVATVGGVALGSAVLIGLAAQSGGHTGQPCTFTGAQNNQCTGYGQ